MITNWIRKRRYYLMLLYAAANLGCFFMLELFLPSPRHIVHCFFDSYIPFNEWFVLPYCLWYVWVPAFFLYFAKKEEESFFRLCFLVFGGMTLCLAVYMLWPNGLTLREEITGQNFCAYLVRAIRAADPPYNVCPSIHVLSSVAVCLVVLHSGRFRECRKMKAFVSAVTFMICVSTLFIKQHSMIDVLCGWALSLALNHAWEARARKRGEKAPGVRTRCAAMFRGHWRLSK